MLGMYTRISEYLSESVDRSKTAFYSGMFLFLFSSYAILLIALLVIYYTEGPSDLVSEAIGIIRDSPVVFGTFLALTTIEYHYAIVRKVPLPDPHKKHPVWDFISGIILMSISVILLHNFIQILPATDEGFTSGRFEDLFVEIILMIWFAGIFTMFSSIFVNGFSRSVFNFLKLREVEIARIKEVFWRKVWSFATPFATAWNSYLAIADYANKNNISKARAFYLVFKFGLDQIDPSRNRE